MICDEGRGAESGRGFFAGGEHEEDVVSQPLACQDGSRRLEHDRHRRRIVVGAAPGMRANTLTTSTFSPSALK